MMRTFNFINQSREPEVNPLEFTAPKLIESLYKLSYHNAKDFMLSGYSLDLALCSLDPQRYEGLTSAIERLVIELKKGLNDPNTNEPKRLIQLAHLESQSYFAENYTDLYDFCSLLSENCKSSALDGIKEACEMVMQSLKPKLDTELNDFKGIVVHSRHFGSQYQYSHGLSVYFPWSEPLGDPKKSVLTKYEQYAFTKTLGSENSWLSFLKLYFEKTQRPARKVDIHRTDNIAPGPAALSSLPGSLLGGDHKPSGGTGAACNCLLQWYRIRVGIQTNTFRF
jgi:hypothetical protein